MEGEKHGACIILLLYPTIADIRYRKFYIWPVMLGAAFMVLYGIVTGEHSVSLALTGMIPGFLLIFISQWSKGKIGEGDGWVMTALGAILGWYEALCVFSLACGLSAGYSLWLIFIKKKGRGTCFAFVPFLLMAAAFLWVFGEQGG